MGVRGNIKAAIARAADACGVNALARHRHRDRLTVVCYHGVVRSIPRDQTYLFRNAIEARAFGRQMRHLARSFAPVSLDAVIAAACGGAPLPERAVLVSFDDGYRNNLTHAAPILEAHGIPAMIAITTAEVDAPGALLWPLEIDLRILGARNTIPFPTDPDRGEEFDAVEVPGDRLGRIELARRVRGACKHLDDDVRRRYLAALRAAAPDCERDAERDDFLDWDEVRELRDRGFAIASHSVTHPILSRTADARLRDEVEASKRELEAKLDQPCRAFVYPNGGSHDISDRTRAAIEGAGYDVAFSLRDRVNPRRLADPLGIDRISMPNHVGMAVWRSYVSGLRASLPGSGR